MDPTIAVLLSILVTAISTAILRWSAYRWPPGYHDRKARKNADSDGPAPSTEAQNPMWNGPSQSE